MSSLSKHKKTSKGLNVRQCEDRITNLPSSLVTKILSYLSTKEAVATSILSTKWKQSWTSIINLDFDDKLSKNYFNCDRDTPTYKKFTTFVTRVILLRERSCLHRLSLKCYCVYDDSLVKAWLIAVLQCNVQELDIDISINQPGLLPSDIFLCSTLVVLKLDADGSFVNMPTSACLPCLRTLHLDRVQLADGVSFTSLLSSCPVLEELRLCRCVRKDMRVVDIVARALRKLIIDNLSYDTYERYQILIDTPALEYFSFSDFIEEVHVVNMDHLLEAEISFDSNGNHSEAITDFLNGISQVESLVLSCHSVLVINEFELALPKFRNLTYLRLHTAYDYRWSVLAKLLENSPCLEKLHIEQGDSDNPKGDERGSLSFQDVPSCFLSHLKKIEIELFQYYDDEMDLIEYILKNAKVLVKLTLHYQSDTPKVDEECFKKLLSFPRASTICKVVVV